MATAEELRRRIAELNRDTAARTGANPASESMRQRMAASNRVVARDLRNNPASDSMRTRIASLDRDTARTLRGAPTAPAGTQFTSPNAASFSGTSATPSPRGAGILGRVGSALRQPVGGTILRGAGRGAMGLGRMALGLPGLAVGAGLLAYQNRSGDAIAERTGLDDLQNRMISNDPEVSRAAVAEFRGTQQGGAPESVLGAGPAPLPVDGSVPENTVRTADGRVLPVDLDTQVNTMSPENFTRIGPGLSQRLGDARLAAAERGDFGQLETDRAAFGTQLAGIRESLRNQRVDELTRQLQTRGSSPSARQEIQAELAQLNTDADREAGLAARQIEADSRRAPLQDPMMSPQVIAERLRQEGADRRQTQDPALDLLTGFEPVEDLRGETTAFRASNSQGVPVVIPQSMLSTFAGQYQTFREDGTIPATMSFADFVSRIQAEAGQG